MFFVYALANNSNDNIYIGYSKDPTERLKQHNAGEVASTKPYRPWRICYYEAYEIEVSARRRELQLKKNSAAKSELRARMLPE